MVSQTSVADLSVHYCIEIEDQSVGALPHLRKWSIFKMRYAVCVALMALSVMVPVSACVQFGTDQPAVEKVQSSWSQAEQAMLVGEYAKALKKLRSTSALLPAIRKPVTRNCVAGGANIRIVSATAGQSFITRHPNDRAGAKAAADRAWRSFPMSGKCP